MYSVPRLLVTWRMFLYNKRPDCRHGGNKLGRCHVDFKFPAISLVHSSTHPDSPGLYTDSYVTNTVVCML